MPLVIPEAPVVVEPPVIFAPPPGPYVTWTPTGGDLVVLAQVGTADGIYLAPGVTGLDQPPEEQWLSPLATSDGALFQTRRAGTREIMLPLYVTAGTFADHETLRRQLAVMFNPRRGDGNLVWSLPDGSSRTLVCRYSRGGETANGGHQGVIPHSYYQLILTATDPYWYGNQQSVTIKAPSGLPLLPGPPFAISEDTAFGTTTVTIDGEVETYPEWLITGPATAATLSNIDTGKTLSLTPALSSGQTLLVRTDPRTLASQKFTNTAGSNVWATVAGQFPELWSLQPGVNQVDITLTGTSAASEVRMTYRPRYLTA